MSNLSHFTFNGRITELLIFDYQSHDLTASGPPAKVYAAVLEKHRQLVDQLNRYRSHPVFLHVFFEAINPEDAPGEFTDSNSRIRLIPVNNIEREAFLPNSWVQDMMHVLVRKRKTVMLLDKSLISEKLKRVFEISFPAIKFELTDFAALPAGGNFIRVTHKFKDIGIEGPELHRTMHRPAPGQRNQLDLPVRQYFRLEWPPEASACMELLKRVAFHIDQYFTPVGFFNHRHLFLIPDMKYARIKRSFDVQDCIDVLNRLSYTVPELLRQNDCPLELDIVKVPLYILKDGAEAYGLCYNNCLAENYEENGKRFSRVYFPDFRSSTLDFVRKNTEKNREGEKLEISISENFRNIARDLHIEYFLTDGPMDFDEAIELSGKIIQETENLIRKRLYRKGIRHVQFIDFGFFDMAFYLGSLHCRVKVIERDCLP